MEILDLDKRKELSCPKCGRPLVIKHLDEDRAKFLGRGGIASSYTTFPTVR